MTITIPGNTHLSNFWTDATDDTIPIATLWERYPHSMMSAASTIYAMRRSSAPDVVTSSSGISIERATEIMTYAQTHTYAETASLYPSELMQYGANLIAILEGELDHSPSQIIRFREMIELLRQGHTLTNLLDVYPDIVLNGAYDLIHLDKWLKQGIFPN